MPFRVDTYGWGGAAAAGAAADLLDVKLKPVSSRATNSELFALGLAVFSGMGAPGLRNPNYHRAVDSAAAWGIGMLSSDLVRRKLLTPAITALPATTTQPAFNAGVASGGVPASSSSVAMEIGNAGY